MQGEKMCEDRWRAHIDTKPFARYRSRIYTALAIAGLTISLTALTQAQNLVTNGNFTNLAVPGLSSQFGAPATSQNPNCDNKCGVVFDGVFTPQQVNGWNTGVVNGDNGIGGFNIVWTPCGAAGTPCNNPDVGLNQLPDRGAINGNSGPDGFHFHMWGPLTPADGAGGPALGNRLAPQCPFNGCGGNYVSLDGDRSFRGAMFQTINGLHPGAIYTVSFFWATAQEAGKDGVTTQMLTVGLCDPGVFQNVRFASSNCPAADSKSTKELMTPEHSALPWRHGLTNQGVPFTFTADATSEVLSFLAIGTPENEPPIVLLDGVSMQEGIQQVPEPNASTLLGLAFAALAGVAYRRPKWLCLQD